MTSKQTQVFRTEEALSVVDTLKLALEALEECRRDPRLKYEHPIYDKAITAIKAALEAPKALISPNGEVQPSGSVEQEPVAWLSTDCIGERYLCFTKPKDNDPVQPLYTTPSQRTWVGLTHEDIDKAIEDNQRFGGFRKVGFAYDLELVLKEKNTK